MQFGDKLKELRTAKQLTQRQLAAELEIEAPMYNRFEKGERRMKRELVIKLANYYDMPVDELIKYWLADQVYSILSDENMASEALNLVAEGFTDYEKAK